MSNYLWDTVESIECLLEKGFIYHTVPFCNIYYMYCDIILISKEQLDDKLKDEINKVIDTKYLSSFNPFFSWSHVIREEFLATGLSNGLLGYLRLKLAKFLQKPQESIKMPFLQSNKKSLNG